MTPWHDNDHVCLYVGDVRYVLPQLEDGSMDCVITSPPYWGLRDYSVDGQLGLEPTPDEYVRNMVAVFGQIRRLLAPHGTCWVNLGDSYVAGQGGRQSAVGEMPAAPLARTNAPRERTDVDTGSWASRDVTAKMTPARGTTVLKPKDLVGIPWRVAFALQADGWYLRSDIVWSKPNPMPESVTDRPTKAHEYVFLLTKRPRYWFDAEAVREPGEPFRVKQPDGWDTGPGGHGSFHRNGREAGATTAEIRSGRNCRSVWDIATQPYPEAHFATYPEELVRRCLLAGCPRWVCRVCGRPRERIVDVTYGKSPVHGAGSVVGRHYETGANNFDGAGMPRVAKHTETLGWSDCGHGDYRPGIVLDPFLGSGTTALVARRHGRHAIGIELNQEYAGLAVERVKWWHRPPETPEPPPENQLTLLVSQGDQ